jgi:hypothetical protein
MQLAMREANIAPALVNEWVERSGLPWPRVTVALGVALVLLLFSVEYLAYGALPNPFGREFLERLEEPAVILYTVLAYRFLERLGQDAIQAFRSLLAQDDVDFDQLLARISPIARRREWLAVGIGVVAGLLLNRPWNWGPNYWWKLWGTLVTVLVFGLIGGIVYRSLAESRLVSVLHLQPLHIDIFDPMPLEPVARFSLGITLTYLGGVTMSVLFNPDPQELLTIKSIIIYGSIILVAVLVFFLGMVSTHRVMAEAKERELAIVRRNLSAGYGEWKVRDANGQMHDMEALSYAITAGLAYEKRIEDAPEWPYTTATLRNLAVSILLPVLAWISQVIVEFVT